MCVDVNVSKALSLEPHRILTAYFDPPRKPLAPYTQLHLVMSFFLLSRVWLLSILLFVASLPSSQRLLSRRTLYEFISTRLG